MSVEWITFDLYSSLIDTHLGLRQFFKSLLLRKQAPIPADQLLRAWTPIHARLFHAPAFRRYRELLYAALEETLREGGKMSYNPDDGRLLATAFGSWRPYSDVVESLPRLQKIAKIGIVANADREFASRSCSYLGVPPNLVITSEDVRSYKPSGKLFVAALAKMYAPSGNVLHVTTDPDVDLEPARKLGFKTALLRRTATPKGVNPNPDYDVPSLLALAKRLGA